MKQNLVRITTWAAAAGIALASGAAWSHAGSGCMGVQPGTGPKAEAHRHGPQGQGMGGMGMGMNMTERHAAMAERMARMHGEGAAVPGPRTGDTPCRDGGTPRCLQEPHKH